jgi:hypothetical protein
MGGPGSGNRWHHGAKRSTDDFRRIDIRRWAKAGMLTPWRVGSWQWTMGDVVTASIQVDAYEDYVILRSQFRDDKGALQHLQQCIRISHTPCTLGGSRPWFICPTGACRRRVAVLYGHSSFICRHCRQIAYASTREDAGDRAARRADRIRARLGWELGILNKPGGKPKWMRWQTYFRLTAEHDRLCQVSFRAMMDKFGSCYSDPQN